MTTTLLGQPDPRDVEIDALRAEVARLRIEVERLRRRAADATALQVEVTRLRAREGFLADLELRERGIVRGRDD